MSNVYFNQQIVRQQKRDVERRARAYTRIPEPDPTQSGRRERPRIPRWRGVRLALTHG